MSDHVGDLPVLGEFAEHLAIGGAAQHSVAEVFDKLRLTVVDRLFPLNPSQPLIEGSIHDEELVELRKGATDLPVVVGFAPIGKAFPGGPQEPGSCLMKKRIHEPRSEKLKGGGGRWDHSKC